MKLRFGQQPLISFFQSEGRVWWQWARDERPETRRLLHKCPGPLGLHA